MLLPVHRSQADRWRIQCAGIRCSVSLEVFIKTVGFNRQPDQQGDAMFLTSCLRQEEHTSKCLLMLAYPDVIICPLAFHPRRSPQMGAHHQARGCISELTETIYPLYHVTPNKYDRWQFIYIYFHKCPDGITPSHTPDVPPEINFCDRPNSKPLKSSETFSRHEIFAALPINGLNGILDGVPNFRDNRRSC